MFPWTAGVALFFALTAVGTAAELRHRSRRCGRFARVVKFTRQDEQKTEPRRVVYGGAAASVPQPTQVPAPSPATPKQGLSGLEALENIQAALTFPES